MPLLLSLFRRGSSPGGHRLHPVERAVRAIGILALAIEGVWIGIHDVPGFGPALADGVRAVVGPAPVAWAEDVAYGIADRLNLVRYRNAPPKTFWEAPPAPPPLPAGSAPSPAETAEARSSVAAPAPFAPPYPAVATPGEGVWLPITDAVAPHDAPVLWKSVVHPDPKRTFAAVAVVAIDLGHVDLRLVAGTQEPTSSVVPAEHRPGLIPAAQAPDLIAAFNGGFKATHGKYGMMLDGETFLPPRDIACTIALYRGGGIRIRPWPDVRDDEPRMLGYRQTPPCLVVSSELNPALTESSRNWGATVSGETIIRRSAMGIDAQGKLLFYGLGEAVTAQSLARAMKAAGAHDAAELDVNYSYPRFLLYARSAGDKPPHAASALIPDVKFRKSEYVSEPSPRDFFYLVRRRRSS